MIEEIRGEIASIEDQLIVVFVGGMGVGISTTKGIISSAVIGQHIHLYTDLVLRETDISIYGFEDKSTRNTFRLLNKVNGVGPKAALSILSSMSVSDIRNAVNARDAAQFNRAPGIGPKTSQKIILYLQDALDLSTDFGFSHEISSVNSELLEALVGLGYSIVEAQTCIQSIPKDAPEDLESRLMIALQNIS